MVGCQGEATGRGGRVAGGARASASPRRAAAPTGGAARRRRARAAASAAPAPPPRARGRGMMWAKRKAEGHTNRQGHGGSARRARSALLPAHRVAPDLALTHEQAAHGLVAREVPARHQHPIGIAPAHLERHKLAVEQRRLLAACGLRAPNLRTHGHDGNGQRKRLELLQRHAAQRVDVAVRGTGSVRRQELRSQGTATHRSCSSLPTQPARPGWPISDHSPCINDSGEGGQSACRVEMAS